MIACEYCNSRRGLKVKCCFNPSSQEEICCNFYIHPLCAFLSGMEIWVEESESD